MASRAEIQIISVSSFLALISKILIHCDEKPSPTVQGVITILALITLTGCNQLVAHLDPIPKIASELPLPLNVEWIYNAHAGFGPDAPLIFEDFVMVSTRQGEVHLIDLASGKRRGNKRFGDAINGSMAVIDHILTVPLSRGRRSLAAYNIDEGGMRWRIRGSPIEVGITPVESGGILVNTMGEVQRFHVEDGRILWTHHIPRYARIYARPLIHRDHVIIATDRGKVFGLSLIDGAVEWSIHIHDPIYVSPEANGETLVISTTRGRVVAMDIENGEILWSRTPADETVRFSTAAVDLEVVALGASDGVLRVMDLQTGFTRWEFQCPDALVSPPFMTQRVIYTGSMGNWFYVLDRQTGELLQRIELRGRVKSAIGVANDGLVLLTEPRYVVKLAPSKSHVEI